jgi:hypothetical protein
MAKRETVEEIEARLKSRLTTNTGVHDVGRLIEAIEREEERKRRAGGNRSMFAVWSAILATLALLGSGFAWSINRSVDANARAVDFEHRLTVIEAGLSSVADLKASVDKLSAAVTELRIELAGRKGKQP